jgi:predicted RNA binding protein YcfA (HicA-like mRNA interferase family)
MKKEISKLMKKNGLVLIREKKHMIWEHLDSGEIITTSKTPSSSNVLFEIKRDIRRLHRRLELVKT